MINLKRTLIFIFLGFCPGKFLSASHITLQNSFATYSIDTNISILEDRSSNLTLSDILSKDLAFTSSAKKNLSMGITNSSYWFKFHVKNKSDKKKWYLEVGTPFIYGIDIYQQVGVGTFRHVKTGTNTPFKDRWIKSNQIIVPVEFLTSDTSIFYIRLKSRMFLRAKFRIATMQALYESNQRQDVIKGLYFGLLIALMMYNLFVFISLRDKTYLYYVLYTFFLGLHIACVDGYGLEFLWPEQIWLNNSNVFISLGIIFAVFFTNSFLHARDYAPKLYKFQWIIFLVIFVSLFLTFAGFHVEGFMLLAFNPAYIYYVFIMGIAVYRKGFKPAKYYFIGFGILVFEIIIFDMKEYGMLPENLFTSHSLEIGSAIEAIVLSFALANKLQFYKKEKEEVQNEALRKSTRFSHLLIQSQENERKRIAAELHDSIGQSLILIKNKILLFKKQETESGTTVYVNELAEVVADTIQEVRVISYGLRPFQLDLLGLTRSIKELVEEVSESRNIRFKAEIENVDQLFSKEAEINIYRIIQEYLNHLVKNMEGAEGSVIVLRKETEVEVLIEEYGNRGGAMNKDENDKFLLLSIKERLNILGGNIYRGKVFPSGTKINITIPIVHTL